MSFIPGSGSTQTVQSATKASEHATNCSTANRAMVVSGQVLLQAGFAKLVMHARQQLSVMVASQTDAAPAVMHHVLHLHLQIVKLTLDGACGTAKLRKLCTQWQLRALCTLS